MSRFLNSNFKLLLFLDSKVFSLYQVLKTYTAFNSNNYLKYNIDFNISKISIGQKKNQSLYQFDRSITFDTYILAMNITFFNYHCFVGVLTTCIKGV